MKDKQLIMLFIFVLIVGILAAAIYATSIGLTPELINQQLTQTASKNQVEPTYPGNFKISSPAFENGEVIPVKYTCKGTDVNFPIIFDQIPEGTKSISLIFSDPDAPYKTWIHWVGYNIKPNVKEIRENYFPVGASLGENDYGVPKYRGPCPPVGTHTYVLRAFALDTVFDVTEGLGAKDLEKLMEGHILDVAELKGTFSK